MSDSGKPFVSIDTVIASLGHTSEENCNPSGVAALATKSSGITGDTKPRTLTLHEFVGGHWGFTTENEQEYDTKRGVFVDVETTGLDTERDDITCLALVPFDFTPQGRIVRVYNGLSWLEQPTKPLSPFIQKLTGFTDEMLAGQMIDEGNANKLLEHCDLCVSHNAEFDRQMLERRLPVVTELPWGCSKRDVPWSDEYTSDKLEWLMFKHLQSFYDAHDALTDSYAALALLRSEFNGKPAFSYLLDAARQQYVRLWAVHAPYELRGVLKERGYKWNDGESRGMGPKAWFTDVLFCDFGDEMLWLSELGVTPIYTKYNARKRFSRRLG